MVGNFEKISVELLQKIKAQESQKDVEELLQNTEYCKALVRTGHAFCYVYEGKVLACAGIIDETDGRGLAWSVLSEESGAHLVPIFRAIKQYFAFGHFRRITMTVEKDFAAGHRMAKMLGFVYEGIMSKYFKHGDAVLYARVS
jgi:hypothetical protein